MQGCPKINSFNLFDIENFKIRTFESILIFEILRLNELKKGKTFTVNNTCKSFYLF